MLFAPEVSQINHEEKIQNEKEIAEARAFFEGIPENGIVIHGGINEYAELKKHNGLKKYKTDCYYYIQKPDDTISNADLVETHKSVLSGIYSASGYGFGETSPLFGSSANPTMLAEKYLDPKVIYKNKPELCPSFLCYEAPPELFEQYRNQPKRYFPEEIEAGKFPINASNLLFEVKMNYNELSKFPALNEAGSGFYHKILERISAKGWTKEIYPSKFKLEKDGKYLPIPDLITEILSKSSKDPVYAEAIARAKQSGVDVKEYENTVNFLISKEMLTSAELATSKNPLAIFELLGRRQQIENNIVTYGPEATRMKVQRMLGNGENKLFKRELSIIQSVKIAWEYRRKYPKTFVGLIIYGSQMDKYKPDSPDLDIKVVIKNPEIDDMDHYQDESNIRDGIERTAPEQTGKHCETTVMYFNELEEAYYQSQKGEEPTSFLAKNNIIDKRCAPIIFGLKNIKMFRAVFAQQRKQIQTNFKKP